MAFINSFQSTIGFQAGFSPGVPQFGGPVGAPAGFQQAPTAQILQQFMRALQQMAAGFQYF